MWQAGNGCVGQAVAVIGRGANGVSSRYTFVSTAQVVALLSAEGWEAVKASGQRVRLVRACRRLIQLNKPEKVANYLEDPNSLHQGRPPSDNRENRSVAGEFSTGVGDGDLGGRQAGARRQCGGGSRRLTHRHAGSLHP